LRRVEFLNKYSTASYFSGKTIYFFQSKYQYAPSADRSGKYVGTMRCLLYCKISFIHYLQKYSGYCIFHKFMTIH
jgi:hypothetical protein